MVIQFLVTNKTKSNKSIIFPLYVIEATVNYLILTMIHL